MNAHDVKRFWFLAPVMAALSAVMVAAQPASETPATPPPVAPKPVNVLTGRPDAEPDLSATLLGPAFESKTAGIHFRPPADTKQVATAGTEALAEYVNEEKQILLRVSRVAQPTPIELTKGVDANGEPTGGLLGYMADKQRQANVGSKTLRCDKINVDSNWVGILTMRYTSGTQRWLRQQAVVQVNEQLYFIFTMTTPAGQLRQGVSAEDAAANEEADAGEKLAVETFNAMVDSIKIIDRTAIKQDQNERLYRTRALIVNWNEKRMTDILVPKQFFRTVRGGKDVGFTFVEEMTDTAGIGGAVKGIAVYVRAHNDEPDDKGHRKVVDVGSYQFMSFDQHHENWTRKTMVQIQTEAGVTDTLNTEFGNSIWEIRKVPAPVVGVGDAKDPKAPLMRPASIHVLDVNHWSRESDEPAVHIELPVFYLSQAGGHFLPRLVVDKTYNEPRTYLFASYVPTTRVLMMRYVDVSEEKDLSFNGETFRGHAVSEHVGLDGPPTVHYIAMDGKYKGSENKEAKTLILPAEEETIRKVWNNPNLTRPEKLEQPKSANRGPTLK